MLLQSGQLSKYIVAIGVDQPLSNFSLYEHLCLRKINKLYKTADKYDYQQQYKAIIEASMVSTPKVNNDNSLVTPNQYESTKKPSEIKSLCQFSETFYVKHNTAACSLGASKENCKAIITGNELWSNIPKRRGYIKS